MTYDPLENARLAVALDPASQPEIGELLNEFCRFIRRYVVITADQATFLALWAFHTHAFAAADATAYAHITSVEPESGKTLLLEVLDLLAARPMLVGAGTTAAALSRSAAMEPPPTFLLDESDNSFKRDQVYVAALLSILNAGYRRGGRALLCLPPKWEPTYQPVFSAKAIAGIGQLPDTTASRSVPIVMKKKTRAEEVERFRHRVANELAKPLRLAAAALAAQNLSELAVAEPELPDALSDRQQDVWEPLFAIADLAGGEWPSRSRTAAVSLLESRDVEDWSTGVQLLAHIRELFQGDRMSCAAVVDALNADDQMPYGGWSDGKGITTRELGRKLKPYGIKAKSIRIEDKRPNGYERIQFEDTWSRYLPTPHGFEARHRDNPHGYAENEGLLNRDTTPLVAVSEEGANPHEYSDVAVVAVESAGERGNDAPGDEPTLDDRLLDETRELIADGIVEGPLCKYPQKHTDIWFNDSGRVICAVCHPPVFAT